MADERTGRTRPRAQDLMRAGHLHEPPAGTLRRAIALREALPRPEGLLAATVRVVRMVFDSAREPLPAGVRSGLATDRRLVYESRPDDAAPATHQLDLRLRRGQGATVELTGQCLPPPAGGHVEIRAGRNLKRVRLGGGGEFLVRGVPARGPVTLMLTDGAVALFRVDDVPLPDAESPTA